MCLPRPNWGPALDENKTGRYAEASVSVKYQVNGAGQKEGVANVAYINTDEKMGGTGSMYPSINGTDNKGYDIVEPTTKF